jgi:hypothetical protein
VSLILLKKGEVVQKALLQRKRSLLLLHTFHLTMIIARIEALKINGQQFRGILHV